MKLLKSQKNEMYDIIQSFELSPKQFEFREELFINNSELYSTTISFRKTDFYFQMRPNAYDDSCVVVYSPALTKYKYESRAAMDNWNDLRQQFETWMKCLKSEITEVDKWRPFKKRLKNKASILKFW